jgi:hypothetical protein
MKETAINSGEIHHMWESLDLLTLDYLRHLEDYGHIDDSGKPTKARPYLTECPSPDDMEFHMRSHGMDFETSRVKGL